MPLTTRLIQLRRKPLFLFPPLTPFHPSHPFYPSSTRPPFPAFPVGPPLETCFPMGRYLAKICSFCSTDVLVPFAIEDGGRLGAHVLALLRALASLALEKGRRPPFAHRAHAPYAPTLASLLVHRWQHRLSSCLHLAISKHVLRLVYSDTVARLGYI